MGDTSIRLQHNESSWLLDTPALSDLALRARSAASRYPEYDALIAEIAALHGIAPAMIALTPGSDAAIALIAQWCAREGKRALLPVPTFYGYELILARHRAAVELVLHDATPHGFRFPTDAVVARIQARACDVVFLCQPNNPLGLLIPEEDMARITAASRAASVRLVIDEAYADFENPTLIGSAGAAIAVLRTFSKGWGLAGARIGYCVADPPFIGSLAALQLPWPVASQSVDAARAALAHAELIGERRRLLIAKREQLADDLSALPSVVVYPSRANFLLIRVPDAARIVRGLAAEGIHVRDGATLATDASARALLHDHIRLGIPAPEERDRVLGAFARLLA